MLNQVTEYCRWLLTKFGLNGVTTILEISRSEDKISIRGLLFRKDDIFSKSLENHIFFVKFGDGVK